MWCSISSENCFKLTVCNAWQWCIINIQWNCRCCHPCPSVAVTVKCCERSWVLNVVSNMRLLTTPTMCQSSSCDCKLRDKRKVKEVYLCSALFVVPHTWGTQASITQFHLQLHQCLPLPHKHSPDGASPDWGCGHLIAACFSFIYPKRMKSRVGLVGWPTADGLPT